MENRKIILGLSGGVDSAASALMLKEMGYTVHGVFLRGPGADEGPAARAAEELGISFEVVDIAGKLCDQIRRHHKQHVRQGDVSELLGTVGTVQPGRLQQRVRDGGQIVADNKQAQRRTPAGDDNRPVGIQHI